MFHLQSYRNQHRQTTDLSTVIHSDIENNFLEDRNPMDDNLTERLHSEPELHYLHTLDIQPDQISLRESHFPA